MATLDVQQELKTLSAMLSNLKPYLYGEELFAETGRGMPKLTVGGILLRLEWLQGVAESLDSNTQAKIATANTDFEHLRYEWQTHYEEKILRELRSRLNALQWFLDDCGSNPNSCKGNWATEAEKRTIIAALLREAKRLKVLPDGVQAEVSNLDGGLRKHHQKGDFIWDERLQTSYPRDEFWWLYAEST